MCHFADNVVRCLVTASLLLSLLPAVPASAAPLASPGYQIEAPTVTPEPVAPETPPPGEEPPATDTPAPPDTVTTPPETSTSLPAETATLPSEETAVPVETTTASPLPAETATVPPVDTPTPEETAEQAPTDTPAPTFTPNPEATLRTSANDQGGRQIYLPLVLKVAVPQAAFSSPRPAGPAPLAVTFVNSSTHATRLVWDFGDGSAPLVVTTAGDMLAAGAVEQPLLGPTHVYTRAGVYTVTLQAGNGVVTDTFTQANYITPFQLNVPQAKFAGTPLSGSKPLTITFANLSSGAGEYLWDFGDTLTGTVISPSHVYTQAGVYTVSLTARAGALSDVLTRTAYITVSEAITAAFSAFPLAGPAPLAVQFLDGSSGAESYRWDFGDATSAVETITGSLPSPTHTYTLPGVYTVTLTVADGATEATETKPGYITVTGPVVADFRAEPVAGTPPLTVTFSHSSTHATGYTWDFGDGASDTTASPTHVYSQPGIYTVTLAAGDGTMTDTLAKAGYVEVIDPATLGAGLPADPSGLLFIENVGQFDPQARFMVRGSTGALYLAADALWFTLLETLPISQTTAEPWDKPFHWRAAQPRRGVNLKLSFPGANAHARLEPFDRLATRVSYLIGAEPGRWQVEAPAWGGVRYVDFYPGVDLEISGQGGELVQRLVVRRAAGAGARAGWEREVRLKLEGAERLALDGGQALRLSTAIGDFSLPLLQAVDAAGAPLEMPATPSLSDDELSAPFAPASAAPAPGRPAGRASPLPLRLVAPVAAGAEDLSYGTFLGGADYDGVYSLAVDAGGSVYLAGETCLSGFPTITGSYDTDLDGDCDAFVTRVNPAGSGLVYSTFLGGGDDDWAIAIAIDASGQAYVAGETESDDFPTTYGAYDTDYGDEDDIFIIKLNSTGSGLVYSTFLGGNGDEDGDGLAVDNSGNAYLTGETCSSDFPWTSGAFNEIYNGNCDGFVTKLNPTGTGLVYSTFLGGYSNDGGIGITVDSSGSAYVTGYTGSDDFPVTPGAYEPDFNDGNFDSFVTKLNPNGTGLVYSTFLGGGDHQDFGFDIAVDGSGSAYVTGYTWSDDFPTTPGAYDTGFNGSWDVFVTKVNPAGTGLAYSTFLGGGWEERGYGIAVDGGGNAYVTGYTLSYYSGSSGFPTTGDAFAPSHGGCCLADAFLSVVNPAGTGLAYSTFLGDDGDDWASAVAVGQSGGVYVTGGTGSEDFPTTAGAFDRSLDGDEDGFLVKLAVGPEPLPVAAFTAQPLIGTAPLAVTFSNSSTNATSYLWDYGNGITGTITAPTHIYTYTQAGVYTVTLTATGPEGSDTLTRTGYITVTDIPIDGLVAVNDSPTLLGETTTFTVTVSAGSNVSYDWAFGDGQSGSGAVVTHTYPQAGNYTAVVTASNPASVVTATTAVTITGAADLAISKTAPASVVAGEPVTYTLFITNSGAGPAANLLITDTLPISAHYVSGGDLAGDVISWTVPALAGGEAISVTFTVTAATTITNSDYAVTADGGISAVSQQVVTTLVYPPVIADFTADPLTGTVPLTVTFTNNSGGATGYLWDFGDSITSTVISPTHVYTRAGVHTVTLTAFSPVDTATLTRTGYITAYEPINIDFSAEPLTGTAPLTVTFSYSSTTATDYLWGFGDGVTLSLTGTLTGAVLTSTHTYTQAGVYTVTLAAGNGVLTDTLTRTNYITAYEPIVIDFTAAPLTGTVPLTVTFANSTTGASTYLWAYGDGITSTITATNHVYTYTQAGVYTITLWAGNGAITVPLTRPAYISVTTAITRDWQVITTATTLPPVVGEHGLAYEADRGVVILYGGNADGWPYENSTWEFDGTDWISVTTTTPTARYGAGLAYDSARGLTVLFGGSDETDTALAQTWEYTNTEWSQVFPTTSPLSRTYPCLVAAPTGAVYLFGGNDAETYYDDLWQYDSSDWTEIPITGDKPSPRTLAAMTYVSSPPPGGTEGGYLLLFGGRSVTGTILSDFWAYNVSTSAWSQIDPGGEPPGRMAHSLTYDPATGNTVLVGGIAVDGETVLTDTWHYNGGWSEANPSASPLRPVYDQAVYHDQAIILVSEGEVWKYE